MPALKDMPSTRLTSGSVDSASRATAEPSASRPVLSVCNVTKEYVQVQTGRRVLALQNVSFDVEEARFVTIVGRSGCGKSTLLRMIAGLLPPTDGEIQVDGKAVSGPGADRGMVFQEYAVFPWKTALENVEFPLLVKGYDKAERRERAMHYLGLVNLLDAADRYPRELSGGMKQRVAVARGLCQQPRVLLMDEPFAAIDAVQRQNLQEELSRICAETRTTVVFVTHSVDEAAFLSDRVLVLKAAPGELIADLPIELANPRTWAAMAGDQRFNELRSALLNEIHRGSTGTEGRA
jgi:NitT/TauT family transport system ATP-binding protein